MKLKDMKELVHVFKVRGLIKIVKVAKKDEDFMNKINELETIIISEQDLPDKFIKTIEFQVGIGNLRGICTGRELEKRSDELNRVFEKRTMKTMEAFDALHKLVTDIKKYTDVYGQLV